ncbi:MAG: SIMPL domain-containing protein [Treponema sp.]|nr:SIMPL domain-containing protein [Treponema sp.]
MDSKNISVCCAIIISALIISTGLTRIIKQDRSVTVRGLAEKEVAADLAIWPLTFTVGNNSLPKLQDDIINKTELAVKFLKNHSLTEDDYTIQAPGITDYSLDPYIDHDSISYNFLGKITVLVRTAKVQLVKQAQADSLKLASDGITVAQNYDSRVTYEFTALNQIKPEMIAEATENARSAAEQFARDSHSKVGKIKKATQGLFSIEDAAIGLEERKNIRVVTTVEYSLK